MLHKLQESLRDLKKNLQLVFNKTWEESVHLVEFCNDLNFTWTILLTDLFG